MKKAVIYMLIVVVLILIYVFGYKNISTNDNSKSWDILVTNPWTWQNTWKVVKSWTVSWIPNT